MRLSIAIGVCFCTLGFAQSQCASYTNFNQCAADCGCQRVACCCGAGCDKVGGQENYNACVPANSPYEQWTGCPSAASCTSLSGLVRTITPCVVPTPAPSPGSAPTPVGSIPFGATFPMIGTQALPDQTWGANVYMGTVMQFNPGAFWGFTNSYSVPNWNTQSTSTDQWGNLVTQPPTPPPDATGQPCMSISAPCPTGYYCQLTQGYNVQQSGTCQHEDADTWSQGAGKFTDSQYYTGLANPPLILNPNQNGPSLTGPRYGYGYNGIAAPAGAQTCAPLPTGAPVCGYKSFTGSCFCDTDCSSKGDCCVDYAQYCGSLSQTYIPPAPATPGYSPPAVPGSNVPASGSCDPVGQCGSMCGSANPVPGVNNQPCYCDSQCSLSGDCCCSFSQCH